MLAALLLIAPQGSPAAPEIRHYLAALTCPGGPLEFGLEFEHAGGESWRAFLRNGEERIPVPRVELDGEELLLDFPHYDSRIRATVADDGGLSGTWSKRRGPDKTAELRFEARLLSESRQPSTTPPPDPTFTGRWSVAFESDDEPAVAILEQHGPRLSGTFLTATGDYRYLAGTAVGAGASTAAPTLRLSCFDGAHAFLFTAALRDDGTLAGDFWSGDWHHETWSATRDDGARLADGFGQTTWNGKTRLADLAFPDLDGTTRPLSDFAGQATLLVVFGSWCPNCNDEAALLKRLDATYRSRGLRILGLAFELTGERARDAEQVRIFARRHGLELPFFLCGTADKAEATRALGLVDRVRAFPTTIFVGADGLPKAIHSGFAGPATGEEHQRLVAEFERQIEALLGAAR